MHLGIVAQGLKMADAEHRRCDRLLIDNAALIEGHLYAEPVGDQTGQDLQLHLAHELYMDLSSRSFQTTRSCGSSSSSWRRFCSI